MSETDLKAGIGETSVQILLPNSPEWNKLKKYAKLPITQCDL